MAKQNKLDPNEVRFFSGSSHPHLAGDIASHLGLPLDKTYISRFSNDNLYIQLGASVRSRVRTTSSRRLYVVNTREWDASRQAVTW